MRQRYVIVLQQRDEIAYRTGAIDEIRERELTANFVAVSSATLRSNHVARTDEIGENPLDASLREVD